MTHVTFCIALSLGFTLSLQAQAPAKPHVGEVFGEQRSASGISHEFLITGRVTALIGEDDKVIWTTPGRSRDGHVLGNGNILYSNGKQAIEVTRKGEVVFRYQLSKENKELGTAVRLPSGKTLVVERGTKPRLLEVNLNGEIDVQVPLQPETPNAHMQTRMARKLANGHYLVPHLLAFAIKEYAPDGTVVHTIRTQPTEWADSNSPPKTWPFTAIRLASGNTLTTLTHGNRVAEFTPSGEVAWEINNDDVGGRLADPCGGQRLRNGHTVICSYAQKAPDRPKVFEVSREKKVVWEYFHPAVTGIHEVHVVSTNGQPEDASLR